MNENILTNTSKEVSSRIDEDTLLTPIQNNPESNEPETIDLAACKTIEEVTEILSKLAGTANQSLAYAIKAQMQVIKYISSKELIGSTFDLLFSYVKKSLEYANEEDASIVKERTGLLLNNFINFMDAKLRWEINNNRKELENDLINTSNDLADNILKTVGYSSFIYRISYFVTFPSL